MSKKIVDNALPDVWATEDSIFNICMVEIEEFPEYLTKLRDIEGYFPEKFLSPAYKNLNLDSVRIRKNGDLIGIEHHVVITPPLLSRNFGYITTVHAATGRQIQPYIFNTGNIPKFSVDYVNPTLPYKPIWINTKEIEKSIKINNIKYKINNQEVVNVFDVLDLIWMAKFRSDESIEDTILEVIDIYNNLIIDERLLHILRRSLAMWAGKYVKNKEKINKVIEVLKMSAMEANDLREAIRSARIEGELLRAQQKGEKEGLKKGKELGFEKGEKEGLKQGCENTERKFVLKLLKTLTPEEISKEYEITLERIQEIKDEEYLF
ncbi:hypothetical protein [uncultured Methanobrevibacter sp.]|uniref:hypothetical protein n=1 Tax=uncultured Methanobrevibacter sp. TaxID=253161 RepID=UPI00262EFD94|nr:hypothetical protein [uncultured Methanobrevibacter sp.]